MNLRPGSPRLLICLAFLCSGAAFGQARTQHADPALARLGGGFESKTAEVGGMTLHYVRGGAGPAVILLHGFPEDWSEFGKIMPQLARTFTVIAVDLPGVGGSGPSPDGYDAATMAHHIEQLAQQLKLAQPYVAGHDIGGMVAYDYARLYPQATRGVMVLDVPLPGVGPWEQVTHDPRLWHFAFHQTPKAPEELIAGRQFVYFRDTFFTRFTFDKSAVTDQDIAHYAKSYGTPDRLRAGLEFYRAFPADATFNASHNDALDVPIVLVGGDHGSGKLEPPTADSLRQHGCARVSVEVVKDSGHFVVEEQPDAVIALVKRYAGESDRNGVTGRQGSPTTGSATRHH